ncbi:HD-GYP domain-containing protein [Paenibacillus sp. JX-17]|uniref:HD-GYP domain-containing protein n=1 Tax=Paenibacillus lacisoli TaxID=3064525 RepID=A0ABT9CGQ2_9BACL|nr:HD-GYP domain-containing protein [Paenibacillus sp. JX-17]MDO7907107.1 HD-GYP domain-containing protein [Paenibacillus sp. JX-17]
MANPYDELVGRVLKENINDASGVLLVSKGTALSRSHVNKLKNFKIEIEDIKCALSRELEESQAAHKQSDQPVVQFTTQDTRELINKTEVYLQDIDRIIQDQGAIPVSEIEEKLIPAITEATNSRSLFGLLSELKEKEDYRYKQSIGVAVTATKLGKQLRLNQHELKLLTTAATLYDMGSLKLPSSLINKPDKLTFHEQEIMKQHTVWGYDLIQNSDVDPRVALVALQHHERENGSGYPNGLKGEQIDPLSKIVALADVYVAMISERPYRPPFPFYEVVQHIHNGIIQNIYDSQTGLTLLASLMNGQLGCEVVLSNYQRGQIVMVHPNYPTRPLIALSETEFLDLSKDKGISIKEIVG